MKIPVYFDGCDRPVGIYSTPQKLEGRSIRVAVLRAALADYSSKPFNFNEATSPELIELKIEQRAINVDGIDEDRSDMIVSEASFDINPKLITKTPRPYVDRTEWKWPVLIVEFQDYDALFDLDSYEPL